MVVMVEASLNLGSTAIGSSRLSTLVMSRSETLSLSEESRRETSVGSLLAAFDKGAEDAGSDVDEESANGGTEADGLTGSGIELGLDDASGSVLE